VLRIKILSGEGWRFGAPYSKRKAVLDGNDNNNDNNSSSSAAD